ncbi:PH domain-like [Phytophthora cactorum]|nr:PH domain-like [Phytophthora cactorum]
MPANQTQSRSRNGSITATKAPTGLQLLSPTFQQSIQNSTSKLSSSHPAEYFGWSTTPHAKDNQDAKDNSDPVDFDFDGFTLESVRERKKSVEREPSGTSVRTISRVASGHDQQPGDYCAFYYDDKLKPNPLSCSMGSIRTTTTTEDFDMSRRLQQHSFQKQSTMSRSGGRDVNRSTFQLSSTAAAAGFPMAKKKELTAVVMRGWLQKRKGLVLKRWKPYYCLFKSDDSLCLYASEDTINGKLEQRYQVLRVVLTDKNDSFHIIGVDTEGSPRREEFRASVSPEWNNWFQVLGRFFDSSSMEQAFVRKPELTFARTLNESEEGDWVDNNVDPVPTSRTYQPYDERHSYFGQRKQSIAAVRNSFDGSGDDKTSTVSSSSIPSIGVNSVPLETGKVGNQKLSDCPMIERKSHGTVPILEIRASEPKRAEVEATLASGFSWTR